MNYTAYISPVEREFAMAENKEAYIGIWVKVDARHHLRRAFDLFFVELSSDANQKWVDSDWQGKSTRMWFLVWTPLARANELPDWCETKLKKAAERYDRWEQEQHGHYSH